MAKTHATGATKLGRDSNPKYLGIKIAAGQTAKIGNIIVRQRGTRLYAGENVRMGGDNTLYALKDGVVKVTSKAKKGFNSSKKKIKIVSIEAKKEKKS
ncbi:MAG: 50S ribosomal protein L27 [Candidatus Pacebacteria bacterium]|nr:50S ribosomal protein L27 [Candidatus Paceibacterota bacterium]